MNFTTFGTAFTNVFPAANSKYGGQLMTEFNLKCRDTVGTPQVLEYSVGPSYTHDKHDFEVQCLSDDAGVISSYSVLQILPGQGIIDGHYVETLQSMTIDLVEANAKLRSQALKPLKGKLAVGLRVFYATEQTMAGSILVENKDEVYQGIQVVVLPEEEMILPMDTPSDPTKVTAHLRLATFTFSNNRISGIYNFSDTKCQYVSADRISNINMLLSDEYVRKSGLNSKKIYAFAGKGTDPETGYDTWEDVTDSLMVWDANPMRTSEKPGYLEASFAGTEDKVYLIVPHKQVDGMVDHNGNTEYYASRMIQVPNADYATNTPGIVDKKYTAHIKEIYEKVEEFRTTLKGKQIMYLETKDGDTVLPKINPAWEVGDYILVGMDYTSDDSSDGVRAPSTLYVVLPGLVTGYKFHSQVENSEIPPEDLVGACLVNLDWGVATRDERPSTSEDPTTYPVFYEEEDNVRGTAGKDYFTVTYTDGSDYTKYYYVVNSSGPRAWSEYVPLTGEIPLAQEEVIGGFLNVSADTSDAGYVYRDEYGRLKLIDYELLRSGTLAYQLGDDITLPAGITTEEVQNYLDQYVNERIAFPSASKLSRSSTPNMIDLFIYLSAEESLTTVNIADIDSRFNTGVHIHILGDANSNTTVNIYDCQKVKIDNDISGSPVINVSRSSIYYDAYVFNYIRNCERSESQYPSGFTGFQDIKLWYEIMNEGDPNLVVDNMTVSELDAPIIPADIDYWHVSEANDNHYLTALHSITFSGDGQIVKCGLLLANQSTDNVDPGEKIVVGDFELPQGSGLAYPKSCLNKQLKVTGTFVSAYYADESWYTTNTSFTALTSAYDPYDASEVAKGTIAFHSITTLVRANIGATSIPCWETDTYHLFYGGAIS